MNCEKLKLEILEKNDLSREAMAHIRKCPECELLYNDWRTLKKVYLPTPREVPAKIENKILSEANLFVLKNKNIYSRLSSVSLLAVAATIILCFAALFFTLYNSPMVNNYKEPDKSGNLIPWQNVDISSEIFELDVSIETYMSDLNIGVAEGAK